ncbi:MAG: TetR/AcrR family transcriptional regulator [bacterium]|nr:TetR/AcrR family transcriptional regulator [bacterium]
MGLNLDDPRVRKTRRGLQDALIRLILQKGYDAVSIQDIATEADTARITFYRHYPDKEALLTDCLNHLYDDLAARTESLTREGLRSGNTPTQVLYDHIQEHEALYRILFTSQGTKTVMERLRHQMASYAMKALQDSPAPVQLAVPIEIIAYHAASAQIGLAMWWLDHGKPYPASYMAQVSTWLTLAGLLHSVGIHTFDLPAPQVE